MSIGSGVLAKAIKCHAFSPDKKQVAVSPNNNEIYIYDVSSADPATWKRVHVLKEHDSFVSGIDWSINNKIVSCGHDRNAYVWELTNGEWKPKLVVLRISRAATTVKWSPSGTKFAVGSGAKLVSVCHYEESNDWWVSKLIKKHKSTVTSIDWHPNSKFLLTGSCDYKCRVFSAFLPEVEEDIDANIWGPIFPKHNSFGALLCEFDHSTGWVDAVKWSPSGYSCVFSGHDSTLHFVHIYGDGEPYIVPVRHNYLPFCDVAFLSDHCLVAVGHDYSPVLFVNNGPINEPQWAFAKRVDEESGSPSSTKKKSAFASKFGQFENASGKNIKFGTAEQSSALLTKHQNVVTQVSLHGTDHVQTFTTTGMDGRIQTWDIKSSDLSALKIK